MTTSYRLSVAGHYEEAGTCYGVTHEALKIVAKASGNDPDSYKYSKGEASEIAQILVQFCRTVTKNPDPFACPKDYQGIINEMRLPAPKDSPYEAVRLGVFISATNLYEDTNYKGDAKKIVIFASQQEIAAFAKNAVVLEGQHVRRTGPIK